MNDIVLVVLTWIALGIAFVAGCIWNGGAYVRGYDDGWREGFSRAIGMKR